MGRGADPTAERVRMVEGLVRSGYIRSPAIRAAFLGVPRETFVRPEDRGAAYQDIPLPIGHGQTISAPSMIAIMLEEAGLEAGEHVLEVGTGSGYHAALIAAIVGPSNLVSIERHAALAERARAALAAAGFGEVTVIVGDGSLGFPARAPYDCILATAGAPRIPDSWPPQLTAGGRIVAPVGASPHSQVLVIVTRQDDGTLDTREGTPCAFVPLVGRQAWPA